MDSTAGRVSEGDLLWEPGSDLILSSQLTRFRGHVEAGGSQPFTDYQGLWEWSTTRLEDFWGKLADFFEVVPTAASRRVLTDRGMPGARWFPDSPVSYAEQALRRLPGDRDAVVAVREDGRVHRVSGRELRVQVGAFAAYLRSVGVRPGDRVAAYLPNTIEAVVGLLGSAAVGAIWSSCSPDFGERAVLDRFRQIEPVVLVAVDGYQYGGRAFDRRSVVDHLRTQLPSVRRVVEVPYLYPEGPPRPGADSWSRVLSGGVEPQFERVGFSDPLWILYSSGTTGLPKPIVHSQGGILLEHMKALALHADLTRDSRFFWFTTTGWMMWNYLVGGLLLGATVVLYDGSPTWPGPDRIWRLVESEGVTHFGTSAGHISASMKAGVEPARELDLSPLRFVGSTGSPLSPEGFAWVYQRVKRNVWLSSLSGGTDMCTAFLLGCPWLPVRAGVIQCRGLGAKVEAFDPQGHAVIDQVGELVITAPMPSMPVRFWGDPNDERYRASYFEQFPGVWRHGDWIKIRADGGAVMYGRSDATINRHGVRMGTAEIYRVVEDMAEVVDSLVVDVARPEGDSVMPLFVVLAAGRELDDRLVGEIRARVREQVSPRHVPDRVFAVAEIPKTLSGKKCEIPVKRILQGEAVEQTASLEALQNPQALQAFTQFATVLGTARPG